MATGSADGVRDLLQAIVRSAVDEDVGRVERVVGEGECNDVYFADTRSGRWVVRMSGDAEALDGYYNEW